MTRRGIILMIILTLLSSVLIAGPAVAQNQSGHTSLSSPINVSLIITDSSNHAVDGIQKEQIELLDNGVPQTISSFTIEKLPVTYGLVVDTSGSLREQLRYVIASGKVLISANQTDDQTFIIRFISSDKIETVASLTSDKNLLSDSMDRLYPEGGQTAVLDAICLGATYANKNQPRDRPRRAALVLISDGENRRSYYREEQLLEYLSQTNIQIFALGLVKDLGASRQESMDLLNRLAARTGGRAFFVKNPNEFPPALSEINHDLHTQYIVSFQRSDPSKAGHRIEVKVSAPSGHEPLTAIAREMVDSNTPVLPIAEPDKKKKKK
jgi:Ca-activated chloride channel family protein